MPTRACQEITKNALTKKELKTLADLATEANAQSMDVDKTSSIAAISLGVPLFAKYAYEEQ